MERFQHPDERQQVESFAGKVGLGVTGFEPLRPIWVRSTNCHRPLPWAWSIWENNRKCGVVKSIAVSAISGWGNTRLLSIPSG